MKHRLFVSAAIVLLALVSGDVAMWLVALAANRWLPLPINYLFATAALWAGGFALYGAPLVHSWHVKSDVAPSENDPRMKRALLWLYDGGLVKYLGACLLAGPISMGFYAGATHDPHPYRRTLWASLVFAAFWAPYYVFFGSAGLIVVLLVAVVFLVTRINFSRTKTSV